MRYRKGRPHLTELDDDIVLQMAGLFEGEHPTMAGLLLFGLYPQATFPRLNIVATRVPGYAVGDTGEGGERFLNNKRIDGTLFEQLEGALDFCAACMRVKTIIDPKTARREYVTEYPLEALRELLLNALLHRDYSVHTVSTPITIQFSATGWKW